MTSSVAAVVVGEVDHGKSTLLGWIVAQSRGMDSSVMYAELLDGLAEEREGEFTLDTTQFVISIGGVRVTLIDVPGHEELLRNMVTGATRADAAVLVVAADDGSTAQTAKHVEVLRMLGITTAVIAVTKMDVVEFAEPSFRAVAQRADGLLAAAGLHTAAAIPVYALEGDNVLEPSWRMPWYNGPALTEAVVGCVLEARCAEPLRFTVQAVRGGRLLGQVVAGELRPGLRLVALPGGMPVDVLGIERYGEPPLDVAARGASVALRISGAQPVRGQVLASADTPVPVVDRMRVRLLNITDQPLAIDAVGYTCRLASREVGARFDGAADAGADVPPGAFSVLDLVLDEPVAAERFIHGTTYGRMMLCHGGIGVAAAVVVGASAPAGPVEDG